MSTPSFKARALQIARRQGIARTRDFAAAGIPRVYLQRLWDEGRLVRTARGLYQLPVPNSLQPTAWLKPPASCRGAPSACSRRSNIMV